jgi:hypothetical protein
MPSIEPFIHAPRPGAFRRDVEEHETIGDDDLTAIQKRPESQAGVHHKIRDSHFSREYESHRRGEQSHHDQQATDGFNHPGDQKQPLRRALAIQKPENLLTPWHPIMNPIMNRNST